ncbi:MAG: hypothetical protein FJX75_28460 [Armatimonadetes bacterium]|nr:hypothetical protein [Armatimonadota bacterium]
MSAAEEIQVSSATTAEPSALQGLSIKAVVLALVLLVVSLYWVLRVEMIAHSTQITESVPVVPAVAALILLTLIAPLLRRFPRALRLSQADILAVYVFLTVSTSMASVGACRLIFPNLTALRYFAEPENNFEAYWKYVPGWFAPTDNEAIRQMYEGEDEPIPWRAWAKPLTMWMLFILAWYTAMFALMVMFRRQWSDRERLTFPIVHMVMDFSDPGGGRLVGGFFRNPLMWAGFGLCAIYNVMNILQAWNPAVPALGRQYDIGALFTERPLSAIRPLSIAWRPENIGLGYLVSTEITLTVWVFYLLLRLSNVVAVAAGREIAGFPFDQEQSVGAYIALGAFLLYVGRHQLRTVVEKAVGRLRELDDQNEPVPYSWAVIAFVLGVGGMLLFAVKAGMWLWTAALYFGLILLFALVYARARAEAGAAMVWLFPFYQHKRAILNALGSARLSGGNDWGNLTIFSYFMWMSRGYFQSMMAYQVEASRIATETHLRQRAMSFVLFIALIVGIWGAYYIHLGAYYKYGNNVLEGGTTQGGYRTQLARGEFLETAGYALAPKAPDLTRTGMSGVGLGVCAFLIVMRILFLRFPLHPLGYAMVTSYGHPLWGPFLLVWLIKTLVLRIGGMRLYRRLIPLFLGIVIAHFFVAGIIWGSISLHNEMYRYYVVHFG